MKLIRLLLISLIAALGTAQATEIFNLTLDTSGLQDDPPGPFYLAFELADGSGTGDGNNTAILSNFSGISVFGPPILIGTASGDLTSSVTLTDASVDNVFIESVIFGSTLSFELSLTTNVDPVTPDEFIFSILDNTLSPLPTTSISPLSPLLAIEIDSDTPTFTTFASDPNQNPVAGGGDFFAAPMVSETSAVPEPSSAGLFAIAFLFLMIARRLWAADISA